MGAVQQLARGHKGVKISVRHADALRELATYLTFTPAPKQLDELAADMRLFNPVLLADAIKEATETRRRRNVEASGQRRLLHQIYTRKVKEHSSIFPFVFAVENAMRSAFAEASAGKFGRLDWWVLIRDARDRGHNASGFPNIRTVPVNHVFVKSVFQAFDNITNPEHIHAITGSNKTDEFYYTLSMGDLWNILRADWALTRSMFCSESLGFRLNQQDFNDTMRLIKDARNEIYHSNPIKNRVKVVEACERLLDGLNFHLGDYDADLAATKMVRVPPKVRRAHRHRTPAR